MAQTTDFFGKSCGFIEVSANNSDWTDISNVIDKVEPSEQTIKTGEMYTQDGENAIITGGKNEPIELALSGVYSDNGSEGYAVVKALRSCNADIYVRYGPNDTTGEPMFTTGKGKFAGFQEPGLDAEDPVAMAWGFKIRVPSITEGSVPGGS